MTQRRTLTLRAERLAELTDGELAAMNGADAIASLNTVVCISGGTVCRPSDWAVSLCDCLTHYCSIDIC